MADLKAHIDTFPLEHLFQRLTLAGFRLSPGDRLRALRVLGGPGKAYLRKPEQLKALLAPVLVRSEAEQLKFYEIFDQYYREVSEPLELEEIPVRENDWWRWLLILPLLGGLWYAYYALTQHENRSEKLSVYIDGPGFGAAGDTVLLKNLSRYSGDSSTLRWRWSYVNLATQQEEVFDTNQFDWPLIVPALDSGSYLREIRLDVYHPAEDTLYQATLPFTVLCPEAPTVTGISGPQQLEVGQQVDFRALFEEGEEYIANATTDNERLIGPALNWVFTWEFGDGTQEEGTYAMQHEYAQNGQYRVRLTVRDTTAKGFCVTSQTLEVKVGKDQAFLPLFELHKDKLSVLATWGWGFYVVLALLGISLLYYWLRWLVRRKKPLTPKQQEDARDEAFSARFAHSDKAPYFIPLRNQSSTITFSPVLLRLADALRLRQEGLRREIDVSKTLQATIDRGGFPEVRFRFATQPSEYLCLIDEQSRASHLGELFKYLAHNLSAQDVHLEVYYYRKHLSQFWNAYFPKGRALDQLQRAYPNHRLLVFGDLHELVDPHAPNQPRLRLAAASVLRQWPLRLLLTPVPPVSWSYREKLLARVLNVFPVDEEGLSAAALHIENEEELLPNGSAFDRWQNRQKDQRKDADTEHRNWRRWRFIKAYLGAYDDELVRWFKALAVFPIPSWEMTIAIGKALGIDVTYDKLLQLARIPVLQSDRFDERLRRELMKELDEADEQRARAAVQAELAAVKTISEGSHAHRDLETALAIQDFALAPDDDDHRETLRFLLRRNLLTPAQEADLDRVAKRETEAAQQPMSKVATKIAPQAKSVRDWLEEDVDYDLDAPTPEKPANRKDLKRALWLTAAYVVLLLLGWKFGATDTLYQLAFAERPEQRNERPGKPLRNYILVKETAVIDSAIIYNNQGVEQALIGESRDTLAATYFEQALGAANNLIHGNGETFNDQTVSYSLANANLGRLYFNAAAANLNAYLQDSLGQAVLPRSLALLDKAYISDSVALDVWHARGVVHYYAGSPGDSSLYYYRLLDSLDYFSNLEYSPNLESLLGRERSRIVAIDITETGNQVLEVNVEYYLDRSVDREAEIVLEVEGEGNQPAVQTQVISSAGAGVLTFRLSPPATSPGIMNSLLLQMRRRQETTVIDGREMTYTHYWQAARQQRERQEPPPEKAKRFEVRGQLLDARTQEPIAGQSLTLSEQPNLLNQRLLVFDGETDFYGEFVLRGDIEGRTASTFILEIKADGYKTYSQTFQFGDELLKTNPLQLAPILLEKNIARPRMELISGGGFEMGNGEKGAYEDEVPVHEVIVGNYYLGTREVTFAEYDLFCELTAREKPDDEGWGRNQRPVINVSWLDAAAYCNWLSEQHGYSPVYNLEQQKGGRVTIRSTRGGTPNGYRLPTEAEWEYAARGGIMGDKTERYAGSNYLEEVGWYEANSRDQTQPVGQLQPNNAGMYDMSGNVWEWCYDWYGGYPSSLQRGPIGPDSGSHRIIRGGAWLQSADDCRVTARQYRRPEEKTVYIGFRLARN